MEEERNLEKSDGDRVQVQYSQLGPRDTLLFYPYYSQHVVVQYHIANTDKTFPVSGVVYLFPKEVTKQGIDKWINNKWSDGLYIDPAKPSESFPLPAGIFQVKDQEVIGQENSVDEQHVFDNHRVKLSVQQHHQPGKFILKASEIEATVFLKKP